MGKQKGGKDVGMTREGRRMKNGKEERKGGEKEGGKAKRRKERGRKGERKEMLGTVWALESARRAATVTYAGVPVSEHLSFSTTSLTTL